MKPPRKITPARLAVHDFNRALRIWKTRLPDTEIFRSLVHERSRALTIATRSLGVAILGALWLSTAKSALTIKLAFVDLTIPVAYVNFGVAVVIFTALIHLGSYFLMNDFVRVASNTLFGFQTPWALTALQDGGNVWSNGAIMQFRFLQSGKAHRLVGTFAVLFVILPFLAILIVIYWIAVSVGIRVLHTDGPLSATGAFTFVAFLLMLYPLIYLIFLRTPFSFTKNTRFIRWNFLTRMHRRVGGWHPRSSVWIAEGKRAEIEAKSKTRTEYLRKGIKAPPLGHAR